MLKGKLAFITGGGSGIGRAACIVFGREGAQVVIADRNIKAAEETRSLIDGGKKHSCIEIDVKDLSSVNTCFTKITDIYAQSPNVIVNSAGITRDNFVLKMNPEQFQEVIEVNLIGTFNIIQASCNRLIECKQGGSIINIGSISGQIGNIGQANYAASKAGVEGLTKSVAKEMGQFGIRCNAVIPGFIATPMVEAVPDKVKESFRRLIPLGRFGEASEVAELIAFLGSDRSSYVNGTSIKISGGM